MVSSWMVQDGSWIVHGWYMDGTWLVQDGSWMVHGWYMDGTWLVHGWFMASSWMVHGWYMAHPTGDVSTLTTDFQIRRPTSAGA